MTTSDRSDRTTQIRMTATSAAFWRKVAAKHGLYQSRGQGAGLEGNTAELLERIAASGVSVERVAEVMAQLLPAATEGE